MAYFNGHRGGEYWLGEYIPLVKTTEIYCDDCAEKKIPLLKPKGTIGRHWDTGFKWAPWYGAKCHCCDKQT